MKLYTEEQVWQMYNLYDTNLDQDGCCIIDEYKHFDQCIRTLIPIELPSDEEIEEQTKEITSFTSGTAKTIVESYYYSGAKWMKEQILNQNK